MYTPARTRISIGDANAVVNPPRATAIAEFSTPHRRYDFAPTAEFIASIRLHAFALDQFSNLASHLMALSFLPNGLLIFFQFTFFSNLKYKQCMVHDWRNKSWFYFLFYKFLSCLFFFRFLFLFFDSMLIYEDTFDLLKIWTFVKLLFQLVIS